jgi:hypothetical protein
MVANNPYYIKENIVKTEEVRYLNTEIPTYEEFLKNYKSDERLETLSEAEWQDRVLNGPQYGPGNVDSKEVVKKVTSGALAVSYAIPALAPIGIAVTAGTLVVGGVMAHSDDPELREIGHDIGETLADAIGNSGTVSDGVNAVRTYNQIRNS